jgi:PPP family 3-phenylpropionic acid transporter
MIGIDHSEGIVLQKVFKRDNVGFAGLQWLYWSGYATVVPFLVVYLKSRGYSELQTGAVMAAIMLVSIFAQPFWGSICDKKSSIRNVMVGCMFLSGVAILFIPIYSKSFLIIIGIALFFSFTENSMFTLIDSWTVQSAVRKPWIDYGLTRGMGSLGFALTALLFGVLLDRFGYDLMFYAHMAMVLIFIGCCFFVGKTNKSRPVLHARDENKKIQAAPFSLKESKKFIWFLVSTTLVFIGFRASGTFLPILMNQMGGSNRDLGVAIFVLAVSEVPVFFLSRKLLQRYKDTALILVSMFFFVVKIFLHIVVTTIPGLIAIQAAQALSFGLFLPASVYYVTRIAPPGKSSTYMTIAVSCYCGISAITGNFGGGLIIDRFGIYAMYWICTVLTVIGMLVFLFSTYIRRDWRPDRKRRESF